MFTVRQTAVFSAWISNLRDERAKARIALRIDRVGLGLMGDVKAVGDGISELRIDYGPGYRVYFTRRGTDIVILLCGGDKGSQSRDIQAAKRIEKSL